MGTALGGKMRSAIPLEKRNEEGRSREKRRKKASAKNPTAHLSISHVAQSFFPGQN